MNSIYSFIIMSKDDFYENEAIEEILREKSTYYLEKNERRNFWLISYPKFIYQSDFYEFLKGSNFFKKEKEKSFIAFISTNKKYIQWLQLRIGFFERFSNQKNSSGLNNKDFFSNGIIGNVFIKEKEKENIPSINKFLSKNEISENLKLFSSKLKFNISEENTKNLINSYYKLNNSLYKTI